MLHRLALRWGEPSVAALAKRMTAKQLMQWELYAQVEPFDETRDDWRIASIVAMVFNMQVAQKDRKPISEFLLKFGEEEEEVKPQQIAQKQTVEEQIEMLKLWVMTSTPNTVSD